MLNLIVSDVVGDDPAVIASGPTVADPTTCADALAILKRHEISLPADVEAGLVARTFETPKHLPASIINQIVARPKDALMAAAVHARRRGYEVIDQWDLIEGEAREAASASATAAKKIASQIKKPTLILSGGEVTVTLKAKGGGGRASCKTRGTCDSYHMVSTVGYTRRACAVCRERQPTPGWVAVSWQSWHAPAY